MTILILSQMFPDRDDPVCGIFVLEQAKAMKRLGHIIQVIRLVPYVPPGFGFLKSKWKHYRSIPKYDELEGIHVHYIRSLFLPRGLLLSVMSRLAYWRIIRFLKAFQPQLNVDLIQAHAVLPDGYLGTYLKRRLQCPLVTTIHGTDLQQRIHQSRLWRQAIHYSLHRTDHIVLVSHKLRRILENTFPDRDHSKIEVIHNGIDLDKTSAGSPQVIRKRFPGKTILLSVGNLIPIKGHRYVLQALTELISEFQHLIYFIIGDGPERSNLEEQVKKFSLTPYVHFTGFLPKNQVADYMAACDIFVLPSYNEGFGIVYIEAMSFGKPVIGCRGQGIEDCIVDRQNGFLVNPQDTTDLVKTIRYILGHPEQSHQIAARAQLEIRNNWTWSNNVNRYDHLYHELLNRNPERTIR
ncbi:MAG: glycosyltransferase [Candidatus Delongbacteria bacterium]|nr:glycosyltransferase [Candidatus Delongbacteria bacterium]